MQTVAILSLLFVVGVAAEQAQEVPSQVQPGTVSVVNQPQHGVSHAESAPQSGQVGQSQVVSHPEQVYGVQPPQYYSPVGMIQVVNGVEQPQQQQSVFKHAQGVGHYSAGVVPAEQYGQPESAAIPPNYKPFGSWGLYIGGNPADGYYTNYYKALSSSVDKQQVQGFSGEVGQASAQVRPCASPFDSCATPNTRSGVMSQAYPSSEYYKPADLNSGSRVSLQNQAVPSVYSNGPVISYDYPSGMLSYAADSYASTKRLGQQSVKEPQQQQTPPKGYYQQRVAYAPVAYAPAAYAPAQASAQAAQQQVVAYPVPVGSQIVGSQPGAEGSYQPYGVHGFTRYAIKPTMVSSEQSYYGQGVHSSPASQFPVYKQSQQAQYAQGTYQQPLGFYGYPLSQLHYSQGSIQPAFGPQEGVPSSGPAPVMSVGAGPQVSSYSTGIQHPAQVGAGPVAHSPVGGVMQVEAAGSEKSESEVKNEQVHKQQQQKRA